MAPSKSGRRQTVITSKYFHCFTKAKLGCPGHKRTVKYNVGATAKILSQLSDDYELPGSTGVEKHDKALVPVWSAALSGWLSNRFSPSEICAKLAAMKSKKWPSSGKKPTIFRGTVALNIPALCNDVIAIVQQTPKRYGFKGQVDDEQFDLKYLYAHANSPTLEMKRMLARSNKLSRLSADLQKCLVKAGFYDAVYSLVGQFIAEVFPDEVELFKSLYCQRDSSKKHNLRLPPITSCDQCFANLYEAAEGDSADKGGALPHFDRAPFCTAILALTDDAELDGDDGAGCLEIELQPGSWQKQVLRAGDLVIFTRERHRVEAIVRAEARANIVIVF